jgi:hypothetical protein
LVEAKLQIAIKIIVVIKKLKGILKSDVIEEFCCFTKLGMV